MTRSLFGSGDMIAFGKRVFLFLAARILVSNLLADGFLRLLGRFVLVPVAALYAIGLLDDISVRLEETVIALGNIRFSVMALIRGVIAAPNGPDCELKGFGESAVDLGVKYWVSGNDDGKNKYSIPVLFAIWNALKPAGIEMPYPHRVVEFKGRPDA